MQEKCRKDAGKINVSIFVALVSRLELFPAFVSAFFPQFQHFGVEVGRPLGDLPRRGVEAGGLSCIFSAVVRHLSRTFRASPATPVRRLFWYFSGIFWYFQGTRDL